MRALAFFATIYFLSFPSFATSIDIDISTKEWKKLDFPNKFPQTFFVSNELLPLYFETGENTSEINDFLINFKKNKLDIDIDADDRLKIKKMMEIISFANGGNIVDNDKGYLINISVNKIFNCAPCTAQKEHVEILNLEEFNIINIYLI